MALVIAFGILGRALRRVLIPPQIKKAIASSLRYASFLAMTTFYLLK